METSTRSQFSEHPTALHGSSASVEAGRWIGGRVEDSVAGGPAVAHVMVIVKAPGTEEAPWDSTATTYRPGRSVICSADADTGALTLALVQCLATEP